MLMQAVIGQGFPGKWVIRAILIPLLLTTGAGQAQEAESATAGGSSDGPRECRLCPEIEQWWGDAAFGIGWISDDSLRYGNYRGLEEDGAYVPLGIEVRYRNAEGRYASVTGKRLALDSREIKMEGGQEGKFTIRLGWQEIPTYRGYGAQTPFLGQGTENLTLPSDWVHASSTSDMSALQDSLRHAPMKLQREILDIGGSFRISNRWSFDIDAQRQDKTGTRPFGGAGVFYNNASQILAPVDFTTDRLDAGLNWGSRKIQLRLGFSGSWFDNARRSLTWDNPFSNTQGINQFQAALEPSNESYQFNLKGAWAIAPGINISGHAAMGEMTQDDAFLPYSINPDFDGLSLPRSSLDGKVETSMVTAGGKFFARINSRFSITATAKYDERDNQTPIDRYTPVTTDFILLGERRNRPYGYERTQYAASGRFRALRKLRLSGGVKYRELDRTFQAIEESDETTWWGEAKWTPLSRTHLRAIVESSSRDTSDYQPVTDSGRLDHPLFRKYNQADRDRDRGKLEAFHTTLSGLGINFTIYGSEDEYDNSVIGLQNSEVRGGTLSVDYAIDLTSSVHAFGSQEKIESELFGISETAGWTGRTEDTITTVGAGYTATIDSGEKLGVDFIWAESEGDIDVRGQSSSSPFPTLTTTLKNIRIHYSAHLNEKWGYRLYAELESFDSSDWAIDGIGVDGVSAVLTYGLISPDYDIWNFYAQAIYRF